MILFGSHLHIETDPRAKQRVERTIICQFCRHGEGIRQHPSRFSVEDTAVQWSSSETCEYSDDGVQQLFITSDLQQ